MWLKAVQLQTEKGSFPLKKLFGCTGNDFRGRSIPGREGVGKHPLFFVGNSG